MAVSTTSHPIAMEINHLAVLVAAVSNMLVGAVWYSPALFYDTWKNAAGVTEEQIQSANPTRMYGLGFLAALVIAYNLAAFLADPGTDLAWGTAAGFLTGFGFIGMMIMAIGAFEQRSWTYILINMGYATVCLTLMGLIIGVWR